jgi:hypothetical protein
MSFQSTRNVSMKCRRVERSGGSQAYRNGLSVNSMLRKYQEYESIPSFLNCESILNEIVKFYFIFFCVCTKLSVHYLCGH